MLFLVAGVVVLNLSTIETDALGLGLIILAYEVIASFLLVSSWNFVRLSVNDDYNIKKTAVIISKV